MTKTQNIISPPFALPFAYFKKEKAARAMVAANFDSRIKSQKSQKKNKETLRWTSFIYY